MISWSKKASLPNKLRWWYIFREGYLVFSSICKSSIVSLGFCLGNEKVIRIDFTFLNYFRIAKGQAFRFRRFSSSFDWVFPVYHINSFEPSIVFYVEPSYLLCWAKKVTGFYVKHNTGLKWVKRKASCYWDRYQYESLLSWTSGFFPRNR